MKHLNDDLKSGMFKQLYLLYGEESYLKKQFRKRFAEAMFPAGDTMNYAYFEGKSIDVGGVIDLAETLPFFAVRRLIILENSGFLQGGENPLVDYIKQLPETTHIIFIETEVDKRSKMYKVLKEIGCITELNHQSEDILRKWIVASAKQEGYQVDLRTADVLIRQVGIDMENIQSELEKLFSYAYGRAMITKKDIAAICVSQISNHIFDMVNAVAEQNQQKALRLYYDLLALKEPPMRILFLMTRQYRLMYQVKDMHQRGYDKKKIATKIGLHPYATGKYVEQAKGYNNRALREIIGESARLEEQVKTGDLQDNLAVELFIVQHASKPCADDIGGR
ncbi:MAG: DNA polymerase III subunit delta [Lachnospiraceae bacterium]|nr:DNA polymerase III subunit delta [Lachnospiraceae bacterium]